MRWWKLSTRAAIAGASPTSSRSSPTWKLSPPSSRGSPASRGRRFELPPRRSPADALSIERHGEEDDCHLIARPLAPAHRTRRPARLTEVLGGVVEHRDHVDP